MSLAALHFLSVAAADFNPRVERTFNNTIIAFDIPSYQVEQLQSKIVTLLSNESKKHAASLKTIGFTHPVYTMNTDHRDFNDQRSNVRFLPSYNGPKELPASLKSKIMDRAALTKWLAKEVEERVRDIKKVTSPDQMTAREVIIDNHDFQIKAKYSAYQMIFQIIPRGHKAKLFISAYMPNAITNIPIVRVGPSESLMFKTDAIGPAFLDKVVQIVNAIIDAGRRGGKVEVASTEEPDRIFLYDYTFNGARFSLDIYAKNLEEAEAKMKAAAMAQYEGELIIRVPLPV